jgi:hypothetical protein
MQISIDPNAQIAFDVFTSGGLHRTCRGKKLQF